MLKRILLLQSPAPRVFLIKIIITQLLSAKELFSTKAVKDNAVLKKTEEIIIFQDIQGT